MGKTMIYLDNAATTPIDEEVLSVMTEQLRSNYGNPSSIHGLGRKAKTQLEQARKSIAKFLSAKPAEIVFTSGGTEANNLAIQHYVKTKAVRRVISSALEHPSVYNLLVELRDKKEIDLELLGFDEQGNLDVKQLEALLAGKEQSTLVCLMHGNNELGNLLDVKRVGELCSLHKAYFHCDTVQSLGHFEVLPDQVGITSLSFSAHKVHGPKGVGFLYASQSVGMSPMILGGGQERALRSGTENTVGVVGMAKAFELAKNEARKSTGHIQAMKSAMKKGLIEVFSDGVKFNGNAREDQLPTVLNVEFSTTQSTDMLLFSLDLEGLCISGGSACSSGSAKASRVLQSLKGGVENPNIRFSFSRKTTLAEINEAVSILKKVLG